MVGRIFILCLALCGQAYAQSCDTTLTSGGNVGTTISNAAAGDVICLGDGTYSGFTLNSVTKSPRVTVRATNSRSASFSSGVTLNNVNGLTITGVNVTSVDITGTTSQNITIDDFDQSNAITVQDSTVTTTNILLSNFSQVDRLLTHCDPACLVFQSASRTTPIATVRHAYINGGCADGIRVDTPVIVEYSYIANKQVNSCAGDPHVDAMQFYGSFYAGSIVRGNYWYCNVQALVAFDGVDGVLIEDNVFDPGVSGCGGSGTIERRPCQIEWLSDDGSTIQRNTVINRDSGTYGFICLGSKPVDDAGVNTIIRNNIAYTIDLDGGYGGTATTPASNTKNLMASGAAGTNISGSPTFKGTCGGEIAEGGSWTGCALDSGSAGKNAGTDGGDVGARYFGLRAPTAN